MKATFIVTVESEYLDTDQVCELPDTLCHLLTMTSGVQAGTWHVEPTAVIPSAIDPML